MEKNETLLDLALRANQIEQQLIENGGEITPILQAIMEDTAKDLSFKAEGYAHVLARLEANAEYYRSQAQKFSDVARSLTKVREYTVDRLKSGMEILGTDELVGSSFRLKLQGCRKRVAHDELIPTPKEYCDVVYEPNMERIRASLEEGIEIPGYKLEGGKALRIYPVRK